MSIGWSLFCIFIAFFYFAFRYEKKLQSFLKWKKEVEVEYDSKFKNLTQVHQEMNNENLEIKNFHREYLDNLRKESVLLPSLVRYLDKIEEADTKFIAYHLRNKKYPSLKAAQSIQLAKKEMREIKKQFELARNRVDLYESIAPWLVEYVDMPLEDLFSSLYQEKELEEFDYEKDDPVKLYVSKLEWNQLSPTERNQKALERYINPTRVKSLWEVGIEFERYIGYLFERKGYYVKYHGALNKKEDLGIDLICENNNEILIVQCKRLSAIKELPVRENTVAQTYGASQYYKMENKITKRVRPVIITSYILSDKAKDFAKYLEVDVYENFIIKPYPLVKCNIGSDGKIYHLPMDQQYDNVIIGDIEGEFYAWNVVEAEEKGFRRAYRWGGNLK